MQRHEHQGRYDQQADRDGESKGVIGSDGVLSSLGADRPGFGRPERVRPNWRGYSLFVASQQIIYGS